MSVKLALVGMSLLVVNDQQDLGLNRKKPVASQFASTTSTHLNTNLLGSFAVNGN